MVGKTRKTGKTARQKTQRSPEPASAAITAAEPEPEAATAETPGPARWKYYTGVVSNFGALANIAAFYASRGQATAKETGKESVMPMVRSNSPAAGGESGATEEPYSVLIGAAPVENAVQRFQADPRLLF